MEDLLVDHELGIFVPNLVLESLVNVLLDLTVVDFIDGIFRLDFPDAFFLFAFVNQHIGTFPIVACGITLEGSKLVVFEAGFVSSEGFCGHVFEVEVAD